MPGDTVPATFGRAVRDHPGRTFLNFDGERFGFADIDAVTGHAAGYLNSVGVQPGDRVATMLDNNPDAVIAILATLKIGAILKYKLTEQGAGANCWRYPELAG